MKIIADFHIHSKYSRATSSQLCLEGLDEWASIKGINLITCSDFTHPVWFKEIESKLEPSEPGLFKLKGSKFNTRFILTTEISCIYTKNSKVRKIHIVIVAPSVEVVGKINNSLSKIGNLNADGRPILGLDAKELAKIVLDASKDCLIIPAHCLTPWFGIFGSKSGFDSIQECFEEYSEYIYALETGLSADPGMIYRILDGRKVCLISNSDAHSPQKLGREANVFDAEMDYFDITEAIKKRDKKKFLYTLEFYPQEGKYHYDGHRDCGVCLSPEESKRYNNLCPVCTRPLTVGVLNRVEELADKDNDFIFEEGIGYKSLVPLKEIIAESLGVGVNTKSVDKKYFSLIKNFDSEFNILLNICVSDIAKISGLQIAEGVKRAREGKVSISPGFDGVFGKIQIFSEAEKRKPFNQSTLF